MGSGDQVPILWCAGLYASGSTWMFNAILKVAAALRPDLCAVGRYVTQGADLDFLDTPGRLPVIKSHITDPLAVGLLSERANRLFLTIRDPRDSITSLMIYQSYSFASALATVTAASEACAGLMAHPRVTLLRYESGFVDDPATLEQIAAALDRPMPEAVAARIFCETRRPLVEVLIRELIARPGAVQHKSGDVSDQATQWHRHHLGRSGQIGRWRHLLGVPEVCLAESLLAPSMAALGYPTEWVAPRRDMGFGRDPGRVKPVPSALS